MNRRATIIFTGLAAAAIFAGGTFLYSRSTSETAPVAAAAADGQLVRPHSPILGPASAPVTIVEFFDPSCEACRAFYPTIKQIMADYPQEVRVVIRYTPFHPASAEAVRILEAARKQDKFQRVLEWLLQNQEQWGADGSPDPESGMGSRAGGGTGHREGKAGRCHPGGRRGPGPDVADVKAVGITGTDLFL